MERGQLLTFDLSEVRRTLTPPVRSHRVMEIRVRSGKKNDTPRNFGNFKFTGVFRKNKMKRVRVQDPIRKTGVA